MLACAEALRVYGAVRESNNERTRNTLNHSTSSHMWLETMKGSVFGVKPSIPALRGPGGSLVVAPAEKATLQGSQFDSKQCREQFVTPLSCFPQSSCNSLAFRTSVLLRLVLDLDSYGDVDPLGGIPLFIKKGADIIAPKLSISFRRLIHLGSFPECWMSANVIAIHKGAPSHDRENYRPISITPFCLRCMRSSFLRSSPAFARNMVHCLSLLLSSEAYRKSLGCTDALLTISHHLQKSLDTGTESYIVQLDFSAAFDSESQRSLIQIEIYWGR